MARNTLFQRLHVLMLQRVLHAFHFLELHVPPVSHELSSVPP